MGREGWVVSRRTGVRAVWGAVGLVAFGGAAVASLAAALAEPSVPSIVLFLITAVLALFALAIAAEAVGSGVVRLSADGYAAPLTARRPWADVLDVGTGLVEGRLVPVVAVRDADGAFGVTQDAFDGFADDEADGLVSRLKEFVPAPPGFADVRVPDSWWADAEAEADRAARVAREASGRTPLERTRIDFGFPGLTNAVLLDYGTNDAGEGVQLVCRLSTDLALVVDGRRYLRQNRKRSADPATQVATLFGEHTTELRAADGAGFDLAIVVPPEGRPLRFNAEEPDRF